ncbi:MAG: helix-turn-helix transcriptional regulator [Pirellulales bacterium]
MLPGTSPAGPDYSSNLRRLMARHGWTLAELVLASDLDERTIRAVLQGTARPHSRTLQRLAQALNVETDELFYEPSVLTHRLFDRATNPLVDEVVTVRPELFRGWTEADFDALYGRFGVGGALTREGTVVAAQTINRVRATLDKVALILETREAEVLLPVVEALYARITVDTDLPTPESVA